MPKRTTLQDVADHLGLAPATVSYALRGERGSEATVQRVLEAAAELGYQIDPIAAALARGRSRTVAVLCGSTNDIWQQSLATALARELLARGRQAVLADADGHPESEEAWVAKLREQRPDGFLVAPLDPFAPAWEQLASEVPVVSVGDRLSKAPSSGAVVFDNSRGFGLVFEHLASLGHRRIAVVIPQRPSTPDRPAEKLVASWAERAGVQTTLVRTRPATADPDEMTDHLADALSGPARSRPTAAFCLSDTFAFGVLRAAARLGLSVPGDLAVVGFENVAFADLVGPGLTAVDWDFAAVVDAAVSQLLGAIDDGEPLGTVEIAPRLVVRGSSAPRGGE